MVTGDDVSLSIDAPGAAVDATSASCLMDDERVDERERNGTERASNPLALSMKALSNGHLISIDDTRVSREGKGEDLTTRAR